MYLYNNHNPIYQKIETMKKETAIIDRTINCLVSAGFANQGEIVRLTRKKKSLDDAMVNLRASSLPNIIA